MCDIIKKECIIMKSLQAVIDKLNEGHDSYMQELPSRIHQKNVQVYKQIKQILEEERRMYGDSIPDVPWYTPASVRANELAANQLIWSEKQEARYNIYLAQKAGL